MILSIGVSWAAPVCDDLCIVYRHQLLRMDDGQHISCLQPKCICNESLAHHLIVAFVGSMVGAVMSQAKGLTEVAKSVMQGCIGVRFLTLDH